MKRSILFFCISLSLLLTLSLFYPLAYSESDFSTVAVEFQANDDYGDAPEGVPAYPNLGIIGQFPTCKLVGPASFVSHGLGWGRFGQSWDPEPDGNAGQCIFPPFDLDECYKDQDAGLMIPEPFTIDNNRNIVPCGNSKGTSLGSTCTIANWGQNVDISVTNNMPCIAMVNVLVDWNQDGKWAGSSICPSGNAPEHVLVNFPIPMKFSGPLSMLNPPSFLIGPKSGYFWARFTISERPVPSNWDGSGSFEDGESEDYLIYVEASPVLTLEVEPTNCPIHQDETCVVTATLKKQDGTPIPNTKITFSINPPVLANTRNIGWMNPFSPYGPPNQTLNFGFTDGNGVVKMCLGTRLVESVLVTATAVVGGSTLTSNLVVAFALRPVEAKASSFSSSGDLIGGWYWLRDAGYSAIGEWVFTGISSCPKYFLLRGEHLVTNAVNGGSGFSTWVLYQFVDPVSGSTLGNHYVFLLNLWPIGQSANYNTVSSVCVPYSYVKNGTLKVRIYRYGPNTEHIAVNKDSLILKMCDICSRGGIKGNVTKLCSGAKIEVKNKDSGAVVWTGNADIYGDFDTCNNLAPGVYIVTPSYPGCTFSPQSREVTVKACEKTVANFECSCNYGGIIGKVLDGHIQGQTGKPCPNLKVTVSGPNPLTVVAWSGTTDANGIFDTCYSLRPGDYTVSISSTCQPPAKTVKVEANKKTEEYFACLCLGGITGKILCSNQSPCAGIKVVVANSEGTVFWSGFTDPSGFYDTCYTLAPGTYFVKASSEKCNVTPAQQKVEVVACSKKTADFKCDCCTKLGGVEGSVFDINTQKGCPAVTVVVTGPSPSTSIAWWGKTDDDGKYSTCFNLEPGGYIVYAKLPCQEKEKNVTVVAGTHAKVDFNCDCAARKVPLWLNPPEESVKSEEGFLFKKRVEVGRPSETVSNLMIAKFAVSFDPNYIQFVEAYDGGFLRQGGVSIDLALEYDNEIGIATISVKRPAGTGASGYGTVAVLVFKIKGPPAVGKVLDVYLLEERSILLDKDSMPIAHYNEHEKIKVKESMESVGDLNSDGKIGKEDIDVLKNSYGKKKGDPGWDKEEPGIPGSPFNRGDIWDSSELPYPPLINTQPDGSVDINDLIAFMLNWNFYNMTVLPEDVTATEKAKAIIIPKQTVSEKDRLVKLNFNIEGLSKNLALFRAKLSFNESILSVTEVKEGDVLNSGGALTFFYYRVYGGNIEVLAARFGGPSPESKGNLFSVSYRTASYGLSNVKAEELILRDWKNRNVESTSTPATIEVKKQSIIIRLYIDKTTYYVNDEMKTMDVAPIIKESRTLLPIRYVAEALGADVAWDPAERKVTITFKGTTIELWIDKNTARVNGEYKLIDASNPKVAPIIIPPGRTMLPIRFIAENLGCKVDWDPNLREVKITYPAP